ncbi:MAG: hypothetical protein ACI9SQ_001116 [Rubritalea sp.]|jgi:hypothetical protein
MDKETLDKIEGFLEMDDLTLFISPFRFQEFHSMTAIFAF